MKIKIIKTKTDVLMIYEQFGRRYDSSIFLIRELLRHSIIKINGLTESQAIGRG